MVYILAMSVVGVYCIALGFFTISAMMGDLGYDLRAKWFLDRARIMTGVLTIVVIVGLWWVL